VANAAAGLVLCEKAHDLRSGVELAIKAVSDGKGIRILRQLVELSGGNPQRLENMA
jgi:anthranilate phosphoribosyltransferase